MIEEIGVLLQKAKEETELSHFIQSLELLTTLELQFPNFNALSLEQKELYIDSVILSSLNLYYLNNLDLSIEKARFAVQLLEEYPNITFLSKSYSLLASNYYNNSDLQQALFFSNNALKLREELQDVDGISKSLYLLGNIYSLSGKYSEAIESYQTSLKHKEEIFDNQGIVSNYIALGSVYKERAEYTIALDYYNKALEIATQHQFRLSIANTLTNIGVIHNSLGNFTKALEQYQQSLPIFIEVKNEIGTANCYNNIGNIYSIIEEYESSLKFHFKSLEIRESIQNKYGIATSFNNIGKNYEQLLNIEKAVEYYNKSISIRKQINDKKGIASTLQNIANIHVRLADYNDAFQLYNESLFLRNQLQDSIGIISTLVSLGSLFSNKDFEEYSAEKAIEFLSSAESKAKEISYKIGLINVYIAFSQLYETTNSLNLALEYYKKSVALEKEYFAELSIESTRKFEHRLKIEESERDRKILAMRLEEQERLLYDILPSSIAKRILNGEKTISEHRSNVCILFADIVGFTEISQAISPDMLVSDLNIVFQEFDSLAKKHSIEKIKTIGDSYMAMSHQGISKIHPAISIANFALEMLQVIKTIAFGSKNLQVRIGIHIGDIISGVIGGHKYSYDIWGDAVNIASRMESYSDPNRIHISKEFATLLSSYPEYTILPRGEITIKGKGRMNTFWLEKRK